MSFATVKGTTAITTIGKQDFDEDDNAPEITEVSPDADGFIEDLIGAIDSFLWTLNAVIPHRAGIDDDFDDSAEVFSKTEREDLYAEILAVMESWFGII